MFEPDDIIGLAQDEDATADSSAKITSNGRLKPALAKDFQNCQNMDGAGAKYGTMVASVWQPMACVWFYSRSGNVMTSWCRMRPQVATLANIMTITMSFGAEGTANAIGNWAEYCDQTTQFEAGQPIRLMNEMGGWYLM